MLATSPIEGFVAQEENFSFIEKNYSNTSNFLVIVSYIDIIRYTYTVVNSIIFILFSNFYY